MEIQEPKEVRENSIVLIRNIGNEPKREPLKFVRINKIHGSRDNAQRVVTLKYNNVRMNKNGDWIGTPVTVDRSVNDLVLVDNALNDSMLGPKAMITKKNELHQKEKASNDDGINENNTADDDTMTTTTAPVNGNELTDANDNMTTSQKEEPETKEDPEHVTVVNENDDTKEKLNTKARRSVRKRVQQMVIETDDIGDCDNENDPDYRS